jgi:hypothetical protein
MKRALVLFAALLLLFTPTAFGGVPKLNVKAICKARSADAKMMQSPLTRAPRTVCVTRKLQNRSSVHSGHQPRSPYGNNVKVMPARYIRRAIAISSSA